MDPHSLKKLNALRRERQAAILLTDLGDGRDRVIGEGDTVAGAWETRWRALSDPANPASRRSMGAIFSSTCICLRRVLW